METEITVRVVNDGEGRFVGRAVGFRGVIASGKTQDEVVERVARAYVAIYRAKQSKFTSRTHIQQPSSNENAYERNLKLQLAS